MLLSSIVPEGKQLDVLALPNKGHFVVLGTAGSGKTTMALLRAIHLSKLKNKPRVLVVTFNIALVKYMQKILDMENNNIVLENYHKFARGYLFSRNKMPKRNGILDTEKKEEYIKQAVDYFKERNPDESTFKRKIETFVSEIEFIQNFGFETLVEYQNNDRIGRSSANIKRENRKFFFQVYEKYIEIRKEKGYLYDWSDISIHTYNELKKDNTRRRYDHIILDEGQDFSPSMIKSLLAATNEDGSFSFFGDVSQQIYGSRLSWRDAGINLEKGLLKFEKNYRNPANISKLAKDITKSEYWQANQDTVIASISIAEGPKPVLVKFDSLESEMSWLVSQIKQNINVASNLIVCRNRNIIDIVIEKLKSKNIDVIEINKNNTGFSHIKKVYISTYHSAKGLEFDNMYIPLLNDPFFPKQKNIESYDEKEHLSNELKLLYVAVTRAKFGLYMSHHDELSKLFPSFSNNVEYLSEEDL